MSREIKFRAWIRGQMWGDTRAKIYVANKVKEAEIMQFTGLKDKNGTEIYEGDIVKAIGTKRIGEYITEVIYESQGFKLKVNNTILNNDKSLIGVAVIGNIYENPELLINK